MHHSHPDSQPCSQPITSVTIPRDSDLPDLCVGCGTEDDLTLRVLQLSFSPPERFRVCFAWESYVRWDDVTASVCARCYARWSWSTRLRRLSIAMLASPLGVVALSRPDALVALLAAVVVAVLSFTALLVWSTRWSGLSLSRVDEVSLTLERVSPRVVAAVTRGPAFVSPYRSRAFASNP